MSGERKKREPQAEAPPLALEPAQWSRDAAVVHRTQLYLDSDLARRVRNRTLALLGGPAALRPN
jgi:hypothetical protein